MTVFYCFFLFLAFSQQPNQPPFKIAISAENSAIVAGSEVTINVELTNSSSQDVSEGVMYMDATGLDSTFRFEVRDENRKLVPKRTYAHPELATGSVKFRTIRAGQTLTQEQRVSALYDMLKPGKYTIQVWRRSLDYDIKSNIVTVTVTPKGKDPARKSAKVR